MLEEVVPYTEFNDLDDDGDSMEALQQEALRYIDSVEGQVTSDSCRFTC